MTTNLNMNALLDLAEEPTVEKYRQIYNMARMSGDAGELIDFYISLAARQSTLGDSQRMREAGTMRFRSRILPGKSSDATRDQAARNRDLVKDFYHPLESDAMYRHFVTNTPQVGYATAEVEWRPENGLIKPTKILLVDPRHMVWLPGQTNTWGIKTRTGKVPLIREQWILAQMQTLGSPVDWALTRSSAFLAIFLMEALRDWMVYVSTFGKPVIHMVYKGTSDELMEDAVNRFMARWPEEFLVSKSTDELEIKIIDGASAARSGTSDVQARLKKSMQDDIITTWTGSTLNQTTGDTGSRSLGIVHKDNATMLYQDQLLKIQGALQEQLIRQFFIRNNIDGPIPTLHLIHEDSDLNNLSTAGWIFQSANLEPEDLEEIGERIGMRVRRKSEDEPESRDTIDGDNE